MAAVNKTNDSSSLAEVIDRILDKGIVVVRVKVDSMTVVEYKQLEHY